MKIQDLKPGMTVKQERSGHVGVVQSWALEPQTPMIIAKSVRVRVECKRGGKIFENVNWCVRNVSPVS